MGRIDRVNQLIKREISQIIQRELQDPRLEFVTITAVDVSPDLRHARVSFSVLGDQRKVEEAMAGLNSAKGLVRRMVGQHVSIRYTPEIEFIYDKSIEYTSKIEQTLKEIHDERESNPQNTEEE